MKEKINTKKRIILFFCIILIVGLTFILNFRYEIQHIIGKITKEETLKNHISVNNDFVIGTDNTMQISVFFQNPTLANDPNLIDCGRVFSVTRTVEKVPGIARVALQELLLGPTETERSAGYQTAISKEIGLQINSININNGVLVIELNRSPFLGGSCALAGVVSQIKSTAKQFSSVRDVKILVNGSEEWAMNP